MLEERHIILEDRTVARLLAAEGDCLARIRPAEFVFKRYFVSEPSQAAGLIGQQGAVSVICQPPLDGSLVAVWIYAVSGAEIIYERGRTRVCCDGQEQIWDAAMVASGAGSEEQMRGILDFYADRLSAGGLSLEGNCHRTWLFCKDIDFNYAGLVKGRREIFSRQGLTEHTHYIASTGIAGTSPEDGAIVQMDALSFKGLPEGAVKYLHAPEFLNPTYEYGVTFERGVQVEYSGRTHLFISGTASIDNRGGVMFPGDVIRQTERMWMNVEALLAEGGCTWGDVRQALVYLRNPEDYEKLAPMFEKRFGGSFPFIFLHAPVCRPEWLVEMECIAIKL